MFRIVSWNVNGFRACVRKGLYDVLETMNADIICLQEIKIGSAYPQIILPQYHVYWNPAERNGYSGTAILTKEQPIKVMTGFPWFCDGEGRLLLAEYRDFILINCYSPHSRRDLSRIEYKLQFDSQLRNMILSLSKLKPIILCGDLNIAHKDIDLKNSKENYRNAGFTAEERKDMDALISLGFVDSFRYKYPNRIAYTWWSYRKDVRAKNIGWRIDYCIIPDSLTKTIIDCYIWDDIYGSDHCPIGIDMEVEQSC